MVSYKEMVELITDIQDLFYMEEGEDNIISFKANHDMVRRVFHMAEKLKQEEQEMLERHERQRNAVYERP